MSKLEMRFEVPPGSVEWVLNVWFRLLGVR